MVAPRILLVVGGGYIGLELGSVWRRLGSEVLVVEFLDRITPGLDGEIAKQFQRLLARQGMKFQLSTKVVGVEKTAERHPCDAGADAIGDAADGAQFTVCVSHRHGVALGYTAVIGVGGVELDEQLAGATAVPLHVVVAGVEIVQLLAGDQLQTIA